MYNTGTCIYNAMIDCKKADKCARCNWNPTYFEEKKRKAKEEREEMKKNAEDKKSVS
jgi:hypothetical protein